MVDTTNTQRKRRPTMMDVAAKAGVSQATVSLVLNGAPGAKLSETTKKRVQEAARDIGYQLARRSQFSNKDNQPIILFIADDVATDPWMALGYDGAMQKAIERGYNIYLIVSRGDHETEELIVRQMGNQPLLGIIYGTILTRQVQPSSIMYKENTVLLNCYDPDRELLSVVPGDLLGGRMAAERLIQAGRRRIGFINGQKGLDGSQERLKGYRQALSSADIAYDSELLRWGNWEPSSGYDMTHALMKLDNPPDAIFCGNDLMALGCIEALHELGVKIPEQVAVIGFDDREIAQHTHPSLTTLVLPHHEMGSIAAEMLIDSASGLEARTNQIKVECELIERDSV